MGYYSTYTLTAEDADGCQAIATPDLAAKIITTSGYGFGTWEISDGEMRSLDSIKWYDHQEHLATVSQAFPSLRFTLFVEGEDGAQAYLYATGGKVERCPGEMVFPARSIW